MREVTAGTGYHSTQNSLRIHFGLGSSTVVNQLEVRWPDGSTTLLSDIDADQIIIVRDEDDPGPTTGMTFSANKEDISWDAISGAEVYDVVKGDLDTLLSSGGDFSASITACVENNSADTQSSDTDQPDPGQGFYYLVRLEFCDGLKGTYDTHSSTQQESRDTEIEASSYKCQ